jgi:hypothetical protein
MRAASIAAGEERLNQSRRELRGAVRRLGVELARPVPLFAAAATAAVGAFALTRVGGAGAVARELFRYVLYVRYRTEQGGPPAEDAGHG